MTNRLKNLRISLGKTLKEVSKTTNIDYTTLSRIENGERGMNENHLTILSNFFHVTTDYLLGLSDVPSPVKKQEVQQQPQQPQDDFLVAFYDSAKDLSDDAKNDVLRFVEFLKEKEKMEKKE